MTLKAIETRYAGCRFRSRQEARWAVFFDALGIPWEYEPEGFETPYGRYLPDFRLPGLWEDWDHAHGRARRDHWIEVKGAPPEVATLRREAWFADQVDGRYAIYIGSLPNRVDSDEWNAWRFLYRGCQGWRDWEREKGGAGLFRPGGMSLHLFSPRTSESYGSEYCSREFDLSQINAALEKARSARFEFGESG